MARSTGVWGIDIGNCALKALRCTLGSDGNTLVADKYDYIEYPKILSQPEADPEELIEDALRQFLSRNELTGDKVAISVSGQAGLSRFFKPPPVDAQTLPDIVKYEVKQQIPFPIEDVIWDWQQLGGTIVDGRMVDAEVGLFAMKRDSVFRALRPFDEAEIEVDYVQMSPLAIFNVVNFDLLDDIPEPDELDPENAPPSTVVMAMGTDTTDLIVTNGLKLWLRNIPIGGNHFTRQLSRELKLTQTKAEHLKRNARQSENPKAVFKAMRPIFNDLVNEVQRSLTFFQSMDKAAEISEVVLLGNAGKLPGLRQFLNKQLEMDINKPSEFHRLEGEDVLKQSSFNDNLLSFATVYGLCIQGLKKGRVDTNLLPKEIEVTRVIRAKKPWVLTAVGAVMLGLALGWFFKGAAWWNVHENYVDATGESWTDAIANVKQVSSKSRSFIDSDARLTETLDKFNQIAKELSESAEGQSSWLEIYSAIYQALPKNESLFKEMEGSAVAIDPNKYPFKDRPELYTDHIESVYFQNLGEWSNNIKPLHEAMTAITSEDFQKAQDERETGFDDGTADLETEAVTTDEAGELFEGQPGWVIEIRGHHFHNSDEQVRNFNAGADYLRNTFIHNLLTRADVKIPTEGTDDPYFAYSDIGILMPTITRTTNLQPVTIVFDPVGDMASGKDSRNFDDMMMNERNRAMLPKRALGLDTDDDAEPKLGEPAVFEATVYSFVVQMAWIPRSPEERIAARAQRIAEEMAAMEEAQATAEAQATGEPE